MAKNPQQSQSLIHWPAKAAIACVSAYQLVASPWIGNQCRFTPTCSQYAIEAYQHFGFLRGSWLSLKRLVKCNPWHSGGIDELPELAKSAHQKQ